MEKAKRNIHYSFKISPEEDAAIRQKMKALGIRNRSTYLRAMMLNGYLLKLDMQEMHEAVRLMGKMSGNINQIARRLNEHGSIYETEMDEIVAELRKNPWQTICGEKVTVKDYLNGLNGLPKSNVLAFAGKNVKITVRPSGTEPKLKIYFQTKADSEQNAEILLQKLKEQAENLIKK